VVARLGYIDHVTPDELATQLGVGLMFGPVTYALEFDPAHTLARLAALGIPKGVTVWLDVEGTGLTFEDITIKINNWSAAVVAAGFEAGLYVGAGCPLTDAQLFALPHVSRYWHSCSRVADVKIRGYCMRQLSPPNVWCAGVLVDRDVVEPDYEGGLPTFCG
jgi:hypothetical protein